MHSVSERSIRNGKFLKLRAPLQALQRGLGPSLRSGGRSHISHLTDVIPGDAVDTFCTQIFCSVTFWGPDGELLDVLHLPCCGGFFLVWNAPFTLTTRQTGPRTSLSQGRGAFILKLMSCGCVTVAVVLLFMLRLSLWARTRDLCPSLACCGRQQRRSSHLKLVMDGSLLE